jgi:hypothetical protein
MNRCSFIKNSFSSGLALNLLLRRGWTKLLQRNPFLPPPLLVGLLYNKDKISQYLKNPTMNPFTQNGATNTQRSV